MSDGSSSAPAEGTCASATATFLTATRISGLAAKAIFSICSKSKMGPDTSEWLCCRSKVATADKLSLPSSGNCARERIADPRKRDRQRTTRRAFITPPFQFQRRELSRASAPHAQMRTERRQPNWSKEGVLDSQNGSTAWRRFWRRSFHCRPEGPSQCGVNKDNGTWRNNRQRERTVRSITRYGANTSLPLVSLAARMT